MLPYIAYMDPMGNIHVVLPIIQCHRQDHQSDDGWRDSAVELVFSCAQLGVEAGRRRTGRRVTFKDVGSTDENMEKTMKNVEYSHFKRNNKGNMMKRWWKMMKDDERMPFFSVGIKSLPFPDKPDRKGRKEMKHAKNTSESTWSRKVNCFL